MKQLIRRYVAGFSMIFLVAQITLPGLAFAAPPSLSSTVVQNNIVAGAEVVTLALPRDLNVGDSLVFTLSGTTITQSYDTTSDVTFNLMNVKINALSEVNSMYDSSTRTYTITSAVSGVPFATPSIVIQDAPASFTNLVNNVVAVAKEAQVTVSANLVAGDSLSMTVAGTPVNVVFSGSKDATLTAFANMVSSGTTVNADFSGATNVLHFIAKTPGQDFSLSNLVTVSAGVPSTVVQPNVVPVAAEREIVLPRGIDAGEVLALDVNGSTVTQSYLSGSNETIDAFTSLLDAATNVDVSRSGSTLHFKSSVPGTDFTLGNLTMSGGVFVTHNDASNIPAVAQVDTISFARDFVAGDNVSVTLNGMPVSVPFNASSSGTLQDLSNAIDAMAGVHANFNVGARSVTVTADAAGTPFTISNAALITSLSSSVVTANVNARTQQEKFTLPRQLQAGDTLRTVVNGNTVNVAYGVSSNATLTALASAIDAVNGVTATASVVTDSITMDSEAAGVTFTLSPLEITNAIAPNILQSPANPVKQVSIYSVPATLVSGDTVDWTVDGSTGSVAYAVSSDDTLTAVASAIDALPNVDAVASTSSKTITLTASTAGNSFTAGNLVVRSADTSSVSIAANQTETRASLSLDLSAAVLADGDAMNVGNCSIAFSTGGSDYDCSDNAASVDVSSANNATVAALLRWLSGISDAANGTLVTSGSGAFVNFTRQTAQVGTLAIAYSETLAASGTIVSSQSTPVVATAQSESFTLPRTLVDGDVISVRIDNVTFNQTFLADTDTTLASLASNVSGLANVDATSSGGVLTLTAKNAGTAFVANPLKLSYTAAASQSVTASAWAIARQTFDVPNLVSGDIVSLSVNGNAVSASFSTDHATTLSALISTIDTVSGVNASASGSNTVVVEGANPGDPLLVTDVKVQNSVTSQVLQANVVPVAQEEAWNFPYALPASATVSANVNGTGVTQSFVTDQNTTLSLFASAIASSVPSVNSAYNSSGSNLVLSAKVAGNPFTGSITIQGETVSPTLDVPNTVSGAQVESIAFPRSIVSGEVLSLTLDGSGIVQPFVVDSATTLSGLMASIDALPSVSAAFDSVANKITVTASVPGVPFSLSSVAIDASIASTLLVPNVPAQTQIETFSFPRTLVGGDNVTLNVNGNAVVQAFASSEALTLSGITSQIDTLTGVTAFLTGTTITVSSETAGVPFTLSGISLTNTLSPATMVSNVSPVAQVSSVSLPTFANGDTINVSIDGSGVTVPFASDDTTTKTNLVNAVNAIGPVTASQSGSSLIVTANVPGVPFTLSALQVTNSQVGVVIVTNVPPQSKVVDVTVTNTVKKWTYRVTVNSTTYEYVSTPTDTDDSVATALAAAITSPAVTVSSTGSVVRLTSSVPGTDFTYAAVALDTIAPVITTVASATETLRTTNTTATTLSLDENGSIYFVLSGTTVNTATDITNAILSGSAFLGQSNAVEATTYAFGIPAGMIDGPYNAVALDAAGNVSAPHPTAITIDNTAPSLSLNIVSGIITNQATFVLTGTTDPNTSVAITNSGVTNNITSQPDGSFSQTLTLNANASNSVTVTATDAIGNASTRNLTIVQDSLLPSVSIQTPAAITNALTTPFSGTSESGSTVTVMNGTHTGTLSVAPDGSFSGNIALDANTLNSIVATSTDLAGNSFTSTVTVLNDTVNPIVNITTASGLILDALTLTVQGVTEPNATISITNQLSNVVGTGAADGSGSFSVNATLVQDAVNVLTVTATDAAQNIGSGSVSATEDSIMNVMTISPYLNVTNASTLTLTGTTKVGANVTIVGSGVNLSVNSTGGTWSFDVPLAPNALNTLTLTSTDLASHTATGTISITQDSVAPIVNVSTSNAPTSSSFVTLTGTTESGSQISVNGGAAVANGVADSSGSFSIPVNLNLNTTNVLTLAVTDLAGNVGTGSFTILQDAVSPAITNYAFTGTVSSGTVNAIYSFDTSEVSNATFYVGTGASVLTSIVWTGSTSGTTHSGAITVLQPDVTYFSFVRATDGVGNFTDTAVTSFFFTGATNSWSTNTGTTNTGSTNTGTTNTGSTNTGTTNTQAPIYVISGGGGGSLVFSTSASTTTSGTATGTGTKTTSATGTGTISKTRTPNVPGKIIVKTPSKSPVKVPAKNTQKPNPVTNEPSRAVDGSGFGYVVENPSKPVTVVPKNNVPTNATGVRFVSAANSVNVRESANGNSKLIAVLPRNSRVNLLSEKDGWSEIEFDNVTGWTRSEYLRSLQDSDLARNDPRLFTEIGVMEYTVPWAKIRVSNSLYMRKKPEIGARVIDTLRSDERVVVLDQLSSGWVEVRTKRWTGFVRKEFID